MKHRLHNVIRILSLIIIISVLFSSCRIFRHNNNNNRIVNPENETKVEKEKNLIDGLVENNTVDVKPEFPGGEIEMRKFIEKNLKYPQEAIDNNYQDVVIVKFLVNTDGEISNISIQQGQYNALNSEAIRIVNLFPKFKPAIKDGKAVPYYVTVHFNFIRTNMGF